MSSCTASTPATVLIVGAQSIGRFEDAAANALRRIVVVEPENRRATELRHRAVTDPRMTVYAAVLGSQDGHAVLNVMNLGGMNSVKPPTVAARKLLPELRDVARQEVRQVAIATLVAEMGEIDRPFHVFIDSPGDELEILQGFNQTGAFDLIDYLEIRCGAEVFHEGGCDLRELEIWLAQQGIIVKMRDLTDPNWPVLMIESLPASFCDELTATRALSAEEQLAALDGEFKAKIEEWAAQKASFEAETAERDGALLAARVELDTARRDVAILRDELAAVRAQALSTEEHRAAVDRGFQAKIEEWAAQKASFEAETAERDGALSAAHAELDTARRDVAIFRDELAAVRAQALSGEEHRVALDREFQAKIEEWTAQNASFEAETEERDHAARAEMNELSRKLAVAETALAETRAGIDSRHDEIVAEKTSAQEALAERDAALSAARSELEVAHRDVAIAMRTQLLTQNDLRDLQMRYGEIHARCESQDTLLRMLKPRLQEAADQVREQFLSERDARDNPKVSFQEPHEPVSRSMETPQSANRNTKKSRKSRG